MTQEQQRTTERERIRLTYFSDAHELGGAEEYLYLLISGLDQRRYDIRFVCVDEQALAPLLDRMAQLGIQVHVLETGKASRAGRFDSRQLISLMQHLRRHPTDILHVNMPDPYSCRFAIIAAKWAGAPVIVTTNHLPTLDPRRFTWKGQAMLLLAQQYIDMTIVESELNRQVALKHYKLDPHRTVTIYHGIDLRRFDAGVDDQQTRCALGLTSGDMVIGAVGRLTAQKAYDVLLAAAAIARKEFASLKCVIVGDGPMRGALQRLARELHLTEEVIFTGYRRDVPALLRIFDVFVLPSRFEGLPLSILEAMAAGKPVIASAVDGIPEVVVDGETGLLIAPNEPQALANAMLRLARNPLEAQIMGQAGRRRVEALFNQERMVTETERLYQALLQSK
ncbi:MAG: glycosyltransferase [Acidobacteriota bacterium]|nr:glycosyltransferase [Blastocatellia bacterium]MDW8239402.1 glycosyltransferase [Acidobacteriota bacterium]